VACAALLTLCATFTACYRAFVSLAAYDDEGYMIWTVKQFLGGQPLYDRVATNYGPFYYLYQWCALSLAGVPAAPDALRLVSVAFWVGAALIAFVLAYRATGSILLAACIHMLAFRAMTFIGEEPTHPQEACIFLLLALGRAFYIANPGLRMVMMGALGGAMAASKINLGIFVLVALTVGLAYSQTPGWRRTLSAIAVSLGALSLPTALMWNRRAEVWVIFYCALVAISLASVLLTMWRVPFTGAGLRVRDATLLAGSFAATVAAICWFPLAHGSTLHNLLQWLIVIPRRTYAKFFPVAANIHFSALVWAVVGLILAWYVYKQRVADRWLALIKLAFAASVLVMCAAGRYGALFNFATPFLWLVAARPTSSAAAPRHILARPLLAVLAVIQVLYAYPVAGSQVPFVTVLMIVIAGICFWDGLLWIRSRQIEARANRERTWLPATVHVTAALALLLAGLNVAFAWEARRTYQSNSPLDFPGARYVRVEPEKAAFLHAIVSRINASCGTLVTEPGLFGFNLWTGKPSPPGLDQQVWMLLLDDAAQDSLVQEIARDPRACVVYHHGIVDLWTAGTAISTKPAVRFISENFRTVFEGYGYRLLMRNPPAN
jgi:hypothetical protein